MKFLFIALVASLFFFNVNAQSPSFKKYLITDVGHISIPSNMELQSGNYKKFAETNLKALAEKYDYVVGDLRLVFQPNGVNDLKKEGFSAYARIIIQTFIGKKGDYPKLSDALDFNRQEFADIDKEFHNNTIEEVQNSGSKMIKWNGTSIVTVNGRRGVKFSYVRQLADNPFVYVDCYRFMNNDRLHSLVLSYRGTYETTWKLLFKQVVNSFSITNVR